ncbi:MAG: hypothetical protein KJ558_10080 [Gammaproteobacteria bacterium]|nr:hypothetical protein [Gammaproteobacteria bacterium]MBU1655154.1 hypothetical protein [Gammaproteobacteria bacterium]MBU1959965.1 hypothetical protein [Gammaproteobacteria bacterium]
MKKNLFAAWEQEQSAQARGLGREYLSSILSVVAMNDTIDARLLMGAEGEILSVESRAKGCRMEYPLNRYDTEFKAHWALDDAANWLQSA